MGEGADQAGQVSRRDRASRPCGTACAGSRYQGRESQAIRRASSKPLPIARSAHDPATRNPGLERIIDTNDLLSSVFLERGAEATKPVCCIRERETRIGTGFLVAPRVLLTNAHVVPDEGTAEICSAEFDYEDRLIGEGSEKSVVFDLAPQDLFLRAPRKNWITRWWPLGQRPVARNRPSNGR